MPGWRWIGSVCLALLAWPVAAEITVPEPLEPWQDWVLHGHEERQCPFVYNQGDARHCRWPARLSLAVDAEGGRFSQRWQVFAAGWVPLPGGAAHWPVEVAVDGAPVAVTGDGAGPRVHLERGTHRVTGHLEWARRPEVIRIPAETGLVSLTVDGQPVPRPRRERDGRLWLAEQPAAEREPPPADRLDVRVQRKVDDAIPLQLTTRLELDAAGRPREVAFDGVLPEGYIPMRVDSPLPARVEPDGRLRVQLRPGHWTFVVEARAVGPVSAIPVPQVDGPWADAWADEEVWAFQAHPDLRRVELEGLTGIDPSQAGLPQSWQQLPAFVAQPGEELRLVGKRRGDREPGSDQLRLERTLWLDFDGGGYTVRDVIDGTIARRWRLAAQPRLALKRVTVAGRDRPITRLPEAERTGVEVRRGRLAMEAVSRVAPPVATLPVAGWAQAFDSVAATLHLPPGWRLVAARGVDQVPTWLNSWSLLDLFLWLLVVIAVGRLWGWPWAVLALVGLGLTWQEPGAPRWVWLHILAAVALLRVLPPGWAARLVRWYRNAALLALVLIVLPFAVNEIRSAFYPHLSQPGPMGGFQPEAVHTAPQPKPAPRADKALRPEAPGQMAEAPARPAEEAQRPLDQYDPDAVVQTGPGLPRWRGETRSLRWDGPVTPDQTLRLTLLGPGLNGAVGLLGLGLIVVLGLRVAPFGGPRRTAGGGGPPGGSSGAAACLMLLLPVTALAQAPGERAFPPPALLDELQSRLLEPPECLPDCAASPRMRLTADDGRLTVRLAVHTTEAVAVPLPGQAGDWLPERVLVDGEPAAALRQGPEGTLWVALAEGVHQVVLQGPLAERSALRIPLPLRPKQVAVQAPAWVVDGVREDGTPDATLALRRRGTDEAGPALPAMEPGRLPPFVRIERTLQLGLDWTVQTRVVRVTPPGQAVSLAVPLLPGESVTSETVAVRDGAAQVSLAPEARAVSWRSRLAHTRALTLQAPEVTDWVEVWQVEAAPLWHVTFSGLPPVHRTDRHGRWSPQWRPWPGETLTVETVRPVGIGGATFSIDRVRLRARPGQAATETELTVRVRSSQGGQHAVTLPAGARVQSLAVDGRSRPVRQQNGTLTFQLDPGAHELVVAFRQSSGIEARFDTPSVDLGRPASNVELVLEVPRNRWILWAGGPAVGPVVLFWAVVAVVVAIAIALGRVRLTPLRTHHWVLLGLGLTQVTLAIPVIVVGWLVALGARRRLPAQTGKWAFNAVQLGLGVLTLVALGALFFAIEQGLLGHPAMQIAGNGSHGYSLQWYQDRAGPALPQGWVLSVPLWIYRALMLAWALWLAFALIRWLRWGWDCFATHGVWRSLRLARWRRGTEGEGASS